MPDIAIKNKVLYEVFVYLSPEIVDANFSPIEEKIQKLLEKNGAEVKKAEKFTKTEFAYPIGKNRTGYTASFCFEAKPASIDEIREDLKISDINIIRFMISKTREMRQPKKYKAKIKVPGIPEFDRKDSALKEFDFGLKKEKISSTEKEKEDDKKPKTTLEDIDRKLDEIMGSF